MLDVLRYNFSGPNFIGPLTKIPIQAHKLFWAPTNISNILPKYFPYITQLGLSQIFPILLLNLDSHKYFPYKPYKLCWVLTNIPFYPTWAHTNTYHTITKIGPQNYAISIKAQTHLPCGQNPKSLTKLSTKPIATRHLKTCCYMKPLKPIAIWHSYKARYYTAPLKPIATRHLYKAYCYTTP